MEVDELGIEVHLLVSCNGSMVEPVAPWDMTAVAEGVAGVEDPSRIRIPLTSGLRSLGRSTKAQPLLKHLTRILVEPTSSNRETRWAQRVTVVEPELKVGRTDSSVRRIQPLLHISRLVRRYAIDTQPVLLGAYMAYMVATYHI